MPADPVRCELKVYPRPSHVELVEPGMIVTVTFDGDDGSTTFLFAQRGLAGSAPGLDLHSRTSPLGEAITGKYPNETFSYTTPKGAVISGTVRAASPFQVGVHRRSEPLV